MLEPSGIVASAERTKGPTVTTAAESAPARWRDSAEQAVRRLAPTTVAGALLGVLVGGVVGRLARMLLARLNPNATGVTSDDGFIMG
jgi:hypothetical protein